MKQSICILLLSIGCIWLIGCTRKKVLPEDQILVYAADASNGLIQEDSVHGLKIEVQNRPVSLIIAQQLRNRDSVSVSLKDSVTKMFSPNVYFNLNLSVQDKDPLLYSGSMQTFSTLLQTLAFQMDKYVYLTTSAKDTIPVGDYVYPRLYGMGSGSTMLFAFRMDSSRWAKADWVDFHLREFGMSTGNRKYRFEKSDLDAVPDLLVE